jgi:hypothetical protein
LTGGAWSQPNILVVTVLVDDGASLKELLSLTLLVRIECT